MDKFEYKIVERKFEGENACDPSLESTQKFLNDLGRDGWEFALHLPGGKILSWWLFKRKIDN
jgi:hypothetical protein